MAFAIAVGIVAWFVFLKTITSPYRIDLLHNKSEKYQQAVVRTLADSMGQRKAEYLVSLFALYHHYRVPFSVMDFLTRPAARTWSAVPIYGIMLIGVLSLIVGHTPITWSVVAFTLMVVASNEYVSYWADTFYRTIRNSTFREESDRLNAQFNQTNRMG